MLAPVIRGTCAPVTAGVDAENDEVLGTGEKLGKQDKNVGAYTGVVGALTGGIASISGLKVLGRTGKLG